MQFDRRKQMPLGAQGLDQVARHDMRMGVDDHRRSPRYRMVDVDRISPSCGAASRLPTYRWRTGSRIIRERSAMPQAKTHGGEPARFEELLARAEALVPVLRERVPRAEQLRRMPDETIADLHASGLFRMLQPARVGGSELPYRALFELTAVIGRGCGSTAWVLANLAAHHWLL